MVKGKRVIFFLLLLIAPIIYLSFKSKLERYWESIDITVTLLSWWTSIVLLWYNSDLQFHFFINRCLSFFTLGHTVWLISIRYSFLEWEEPEIIEKIKASFLQLNKTIKIKEETESYLELLWDNKFLISLKLQKTEFSSFELHFYTSRIIVPTSENKKQIREITEIVEAMERLLIINATDSIQYDLDIEYSKRSPYYSYWVRKLPEEVIGNFNVSIKLPDKTDHISVNKNHLIIRSKSCHRLFQLATDYVTLKPAS
jgi:hypothetical protein